jgi:hypothetical protein
MPTDNKILKLVLDTVLGLKTDVTELKTDVTEIKTRLSNVEKVQTEHGHHLTAIHGEVMQNGERLTHIDAKVDRNARVRA